MFVAQALSLNVCCPGLVLYTDGFFDGYDPTVNPGAGEVLDTELDKCVVYICLISIKIDFSLLE